MPEDNDKPADPKDAAQGGKDDHRKRRGTKWTKKVWGSLSALAVIGGVLGFGTEVGH